MAGKSGPDEKAREILRRFEALKDERRQFEPLWKECEWNAASVIQDWDDEKPKSPYKIPARITNKPANFLNTCVTGIAGYSISPNIKRFKLPLQDGGAAEASGVPQWLEKCEAVMRRVFERRGLYQKSLRWLELAALYGQSAMLIEEMSGTDAPIRFHVPETQELYFDNNEAGETEIVFRSYWTDVENAVNHYGKKAMHENILKAYEDAEKSGGEYGWFPDTSMKLLHAVFLRRTGKGDASDTVTGKKWAGYIIDIANKHIIKETGYDEFPYAVFFWEKAGKPYGIPPTMKAANDIALYQEAVKTLLTVAEYSANPAKVVPETMRGNENFQPGGFNYYRSPEMLPRQLDVGTNYPITIQITQELAQNIKEWYNVDFFLMLRQQTNLQNMTATAVQTLQGEQAALLSALVANLFDGMNTIISRTFNILAKKKLLPPLPFALQVKGGGLKVDFLGVLAQAQKAAYEYTGIMDVLAVAGQFAQFGKIDPEWAKVVNWLKPETVFKRAIESRGAPAETLRTRDEYEEIMSATAEREAGAMNAQAAAQQNQAVLQNAQNLNQKVQEGSMLAGMLGGNKQ